MQSLLEEVFVLAQRSLQAHLEQRDDLDFASLAEKLDEAVIEEADFGPLFERASGVDPMLAQYLRRVARTVAAEDVVPAGRTTYRLVLAGMGVLMPPGLSPLSRTWRDVALELESGLAAMWAEYVHTVTVLRHPVTVERACAMSPTQTRSALLQGFAQRQAEEFEVPENESFGLRELAPYVLPLVIAVKPEHAKDFIARELAPGPLSNAFSSLKHRMEAKFEAADVSTTAPALFPPLSWSNVFSVVRAMHLRRAVQTTIAASSKKEGWSLVFNAPWLCLQDPAGRSTKEFHFPEETASDIQAMVAPLVQKLGLRFQGSGLH
ncbi:hypothetical protein [Burkholderia cenocepacia]|uniref:hypothetical protein n=1 Tax=Burkholderia cenocepacia TaxID=95486 RepID=UPI0012374765|nr:hypothetical protein [Burkholderia cenocepacia]